MREKEVEMKKGIMYLRMLLKRQMKKGSIYLILAAIFASTFFIRHAAVHYTIDVKIGFCMEEQKDVMVQRIQMAMEEHRGLVRFVCYDGEADLKRAVQRGEVYAGYFFTGEFDSTRDVDCMEGSVRVFAQPESFVPKVANELVFSYIMQEYAYRILQECTTEVLWFTEDAEETETVLRECYEENLTNGSTFSVEYSGNKERQTSSVELDVFDYLTPVARGIAATLIFLAGLCGALLYYQDRENGVFSRMTIYQRELFCLAEILLPVLLSGITTYLCFLCTGIWELTWETCLHMAEYLLLVTLYCDVLRLFVRRKIVFLMLIPVFLMASLLFCNVFVNLSSFVPALDVISRLLPPGYFS